MKKFRFNPYQVQLLEQLSEDYNIVVVTDILETFDVEVYQCTEFRPADNVSNFSSITNYRKITNLIDDNSAYVSSTNNSIKIVSDKIERIASINKTRNFQTNQFGVYKL